MCRSVLLFVALGLLVAGCERRDDAQEARALAARALRGALAYPQSSLISVSAGDEAAQVVFSSPVAVSQVAAWYRQALVLNGWELRSDAQDRSGMVTIYAERREQPLWVTLRPNVGAPGTTYTLVGAVLEGDSIK